MNENHVYDMIIVGGGPGGYTSALYAARAGLDTIVIEKLSAGVTWTTEGSDSLEDLKSLEAQGVEIMTCGTCLDYYGLKDKLAVGTVTNMYSIVETMAKAGRIVRPS